MDLLHLADRCSIVGPIDMELESPRPIEAPRPAEPPRSVEVPRPAISVVCDKLPPLSYGYDVANLVFEITPHPTDLLSLHIFVDGNSIQTCYMDCIGMKGDTTAIYKPQSFGLYDEILKRKVEVQVTKRILGFHVGQRISIPKMVACPNIQIAGKIVQCGNTIRVLQKYECHMKAVVPSSDDIVCTVFKQRSTNENHLIPMYRLTYTSTYLLDRQDILFSKDAPVTVFLLWKKAIVDTTTKKVVAYEDIQISPCDMVDRDPADMLRAKPKDVPVSPAPAESSSSRDEVMGSSLDDAEAHIEPIQSKTGDKESLPPKKRKRLVLESESSEDHEERKEKPVKKKKHRTGIVRLLISGLATRKTASSKATAIDKMGIDLCDRDEPFYDNVKRTWCVRVYVAYEDAKRLIYRYGEQRRKGGKDEDLEAVIE